jgi:hypothetical protein
MKQIRVRSFHLTFHGRQNNTVPLKVYLFHLKGKTFSHNGHITRYVLEVSAPSTLQKDPGFKRPPSTLHVLRDNFSEHLVFSASHCPSFR